MFDIGFFELVLIGIVALIVIGPERLPGVARATGLWVGKLRGFVSSVKRDIDQELKAEELQRILKKHADSNSIHEIIEETRQATEELKQQDYALRAIPDAPKEQPAQAKDSQPASTPSTDNNAVNKFAVKPGKTDE